MLKALLTILLGHWKSSAKPPDDTPDEIAAILVEDLLYGDQVISKAVACGNAILPAIREKTLDFSDMNNRNAFWIADILGSVHTESCHALLQELHGRQDSLIRIVASVAMIEQDLYKETINDDSLFVRTVRGERDDWSEYRDAEQELSVIALGKCRHVNGLPCLREVLDGSHNDYWFDAYACDAVARIGDRSATPTLRHCLLTPGFHALPNAFRALIALGEKEAVPLAIARVERKLRGYNSGWVVQELKRVTGQDFGYDRRRWEEWWRVAGDRWEIPAEFRVPFDEQPSVY